jgi:ABC-type polysaccharide/polyol phosphate export permease
MESATESSQLRDIRGPSAVGGGWGRFWNLLWLTSKAEFKRRYAGTRLGYLWAVLRPFLFFAVLYVFVVIILERFSGQIANYPVMLLVNITLFQFFSDSVGQATRSLERGALIRKVTLPQVVLPLASVLTTALSAGIALLIAIVWTLAYGVEPTWDWLLFPIAVVWLVAITVATSLLTSSTYVRHKDIGQIVPTITRTLFYLTPVLFPLEALPRQWLIKLECFNPLAPVFAQVRVWLIDPSAPGWFEFVNGPLQWMPFILFVLLCVVGWVVFSRRARLMAEEI